eukprot:TRINITY_DN18363_c0_g1_i1.p1 TRINITY_DN18363_c0_g1~~TRINITY_DN18363_c0_g1_i1.p1  ORF type:complete len:662 (+),score=78.53 TRINITY_DN18363_c0_g1_i1:288-1988(+)
MDFFNLYHMNEWVIKPATLEKNCAFVELLTAKQQAPVWFISHWWGEPIQPFLKCVQHHYKVRRLSAESYYWVCAYANRQHALGDVSANPRDTNFFKAMQVAVGVLLTLDEVGPATPFSRMWCMFEEFVALMKDPDREQRLLLDIATCTPSSVELLTDGLTDSDRKGFDPGQDKQKREQTFPLEVIRAGLSVSIQDAAAFVDIDRHHILNCIAGRDLELIPSLPEHEEYERVNARLRASFAAAVWPKALEDGMVEDLNLQRTLSADTTRDLLIMNFLCNSNMTDDALLQLGRGLPCSLQTLELGFDGCCHISAEGFGEFVRIIPVTQVTSFSLKLNAITSFRTEEIGQMMAKLQQASSLRSLSLSFETCVQVDDKMLATIAVYLQQSVAKLELNLQGTRITDKGLAALATKLPKGLEQLELVLNFCRGVGDSGIAALRLNLPDGVKKLRLFLVRSRVGEAIAEECKTYGSFRAWKPSASDAAEPLDMSSIEAAAQNQAKPQASTLPGMLVNQAENHSENKDACTVSASSSSSPAEEQSTSQRRSRTSRLRCCFGSKVRDSKGSSETE